jgi:hypothetical protein
VTSRDAGEALLWAGIVMLLVTAGSVRELTGNEFAAWFAVGGIMLGAGLFLLYGDRRWPRP